MADLNWVASGVRNRAERVAVFFLTSRIGKVEKLWKS